MVDSAVRVALLAKAGDARNQLRNALSELGAELVAEGDPNEMDQQSVIAKQPKLVLVGLEPAIELGLERFDDLLSSNDVEVIYDDAEVTATLTGWDLNRWARHLAAKIVGSDVLPPVPEDAVMLSESELQPSPGAVPTPADLMQDAKLEDYTVETMAMAADVPSSDFIQSLDNTSTQVKTQIEVTDSYSEPVDESAIAEFVAPVVESKVQEPSAEDFQIDTLDVEQAMQRIEFAEQEAQPLNVLQDASTSVEQMPVSEFPDAGSSYSVEEISISTFEDDTAELDSNSVNEEIISFESNDSFDSSSSDFAFDESSADLDAKFNSPEPVSFSSFETQDELATSDELDSDVAALAEQMASIEKDVPTEKVEEFGFSMEPPAAPEPKITQELKVDPIAEPAKAKLDFSSLSLVDMNESAVSANNKPAPAEFKQAPIETPAPVESKPVASKFDASKLQILQESAGDADAVVMLLAGLGGPDAIRQFISNLNPASKLLVLIQQRLEVGSYDRLATQFGKVSKLPVLLAQAGMSAEAGKCYVVPANMGLHNDNGMLSFVDGLDEVATINALPPTKTHLLIASGASIALLDDVRKFRNLGVNVRVQTPAECFEGEAAQALANDGVQSVNPREWPQELAG